MHLVLLETGGDGGVELKGSRLILGPTGQVAKSALGQTPAVERTRTAGFQGNGGVVISQRLVVPFELQVGEAPAGEGLGRRGSSERGIAVREGAGKLPVIARSRQRAASISGCAGLNLSASVKSSIA